MRGAEMRWVLRLLVYLGGLFVVALGINIALVSNLGVSPISAFNVPISRVSEISLGTVTAVVYIVFVGVQIFILGKGFHWSLLLQLLFGSVFGAFLDLAKPLVAWLPAGSYPLQLLWMVVGIGVVGTGASFYLAMEVVPNPPDGLVLSITRRWNLDFAKVKIITDCICVAGGAAIGLIFAGELVAIREGTVISALLTGRLMGLVTKAIAPWAKTLRAPAKGE